jgi:ABC-type phosphate/phosphonate transport system substrate-binding protein
MFRPALVILVALTALGAGSAASGRSGREPEIVKVAMIAHLFEGESKDTMLKQMGPFVAKLEKQTGTRSEFTIIDDLPTLTRELNEGKVQIAVLPSLDYAWARPDLPGVKPLIVAAVDGGKLKTTVLAAQKSGLESLSDLKGKSLAWSRRTPRYVKFFLAHEMGEAPDRAFQAKEFASVDQALDAVIEGAAEAAAITGAAARVYEDQRPGRYRRLKVIAESVDFPPPVVVYQTKGANEERIKRFADGMLKANQTTEGQQTLTLWRLKGFETLPLDYDQQLEAILRKYPKP